MTKKFTFFAIFLFFSFSKVYSQDNFIDLTTFLEKRTKQYPLLIGDQIYLNTPERTGSTLVYNILRFLFENDVYIPGFHKTENIVVKTHAAGISIQPNNIYVYTIRNPIDASLSKYRIECSRNKKILPMNSLNQFVNKQIVHARRLKQLVNNNKNVYVLKYENFVDDFRYLFNFIENNFHITIAKKDKLLLKKALNKKNVIKNTQNYNTFAQSDKHSLFHGSHIDQGELSEELTTQVLQGIRSRLSDYSDLYQEWGYDLSE